MDTLSIREASTLTGLSAHTLRYYERIGLLEPVARNTSGHRRYARNDLEHLQFLHCLRATGMPIRRLKEFATLIQGGQAAQDARLALLEAHRLDVQAHITDLQEKLHIIEGKIQRIAEYGKSSQAKIAVGQDFQEG